MTIDWAQIWAVLTWPVLLVVLALAGLALRHLVVFLASKSQDQSLATWYRYAYMLVQAAEQMLPDDANDQKYDLVRTALRSYFPALTDGQIKQLVESAVLEMNNMLKSLPAPETAPTAIR